MSRSLDLEEQVQRARKDWHKASERAARIALELFQPGNSYGNPDARFQDEHLLNSARFEADRLFKHYDALERQLTDNKMLSLQASQKLATWGSFAVALSVGSATIAEFLLKLLN